MGEELIFNGINGATGGYLLPPISSQELSAIAKGESRDKEHLYDLRLRHQQATSIKRGVKAGIDPLNLSSAGWGIIFADREVENVSALKEALGGLLGLRKSQAGERYREFSAQDGYQEGESYINFLARHGIGPGPADPERVPYYLLIVADPESIPFEFQYQLDVQYAVGRIYFETLEQYAQYAQSVVEVETGKHVLPRQLAFFGVQNQDDRSTQLSATHLIEPLAEKISEEGAWEVKSLIGDEATKSALGGMMGEAQPPALLFSASHGMGFPKDDPRQFPHQGALLCQDWPGPKMWKEPIPEDHYFSASDVPPEANFSGSVALHFACYGAGTPHMDDFAHQAFMEPKAIASKAFVARLPQRLLSHPRGGMQAVIGHVERAWGYSFVWEQSGSQLAVFESALKRMMGGAPVGYAMEYFNERYAELSMVLSTELQGVQFGKEVDEVQLAGMWTANNDARSYIILGDPAVRIPISRSKLDQEQMQQVITTSFKESGIQAEPAIDFVPGIGEDSASPAEFDRTLAVEGGQSVDELSLLALEGIKEHGTQAQKATILSSLGDSHSKSPSGDRGENLKAAISAYLAALRLFPADGEPPNHIQTRRSLADAYAELFSMTGKFSFADHAEQSYLDILLTISRDVDVILWGEVTISLADLYSLQYKRSGEMQPAEQALKAYRQVMKEVSRQRAPLLWAKCTYELANLQMDLLSVTGKESLRSEAFENYQAALEIYSMELFPYQFVSVKIKLGDLYMGHEDGDRVESIELAIQAYESVREEIKQVADVIPEAHLYTRLGDAFAQRRQGDKTKNIFLALAYYKQSLALARENGDEAAGRELEDKIGNLRSDG